MHTPRNPKLPSSRIYAERLYAFTLLEVILAVTIAGALLAAAATLLVSVSDVWMERQDRHFFEDHVDGVTEFLHASFIVAGTTIAPNEAENDSNTNTEVPGDQSQDRESGDVNAEVSVTDGSDNSNTNTVPDSSDASGGLVSVAEEPIDWARPPGFADYQDPLLHFSLKDTPPLLVQTENAPIVGIEAFLHFEDDEGLSLLWYTPLQEDSDDINDLRRTPLSDLVTKIEYIYWDDSFDKWETETEAQESDGDDQFTLPRFLKLTFEYQGETKERTITIPVPSRSVLIF